MPSTIDSGASCLLQRRHHTWLREEATTDRAPQVPPRRSGASEGPIQVLVMGLANKPSSGLRMQQRYAEGLLLAALYAVCAERSRLI